MFAGVRPYPPRYAPIQMTLRFVLLAAAVLAAPLAEAAVTPRPAVTLVYESDATVTDFRLSSPRPNPFTTLTRLELTVDAPTDLTVAVYDALGCAGVARVDFFVTADGPVLNEVNTMPGSTEQSQVPKMFAAAGVSYADLLDRLVRDVLPS